MRIRKNPRAGIPTFSKLTIVVEETRVEKQPTRYHPFAPVEAEICRQWVFRLETTESLKLTLSGYVVSVRHKGQQKFWLKEAWTAGYPHWDCWNFPNGKGRRVVPHQINAGDFSVPPGIQLRAMQTLLNRVKLVLPEPEPATEAIPVPAVVNEPVVFVASGEE